MVFPCSITRRRRQCGGPELRIPVVQSRIRRLSRYLLAVAHGGGAGSCRRRQTPLLETGCRAFPRHRIISGLHEPGSCLSRALSLGPDSYLSVMEDGQQGVNNIGTIIHFAQNIQIDVRPVECPDLRLGYATLMSLSTSIMPRIVLHSKSLSAACWRAIRRRSPINS